MYYGLLSLVMVLKKYKLYVIILDVVFIILRSFLQIIHIDKSIVITKIFKSSKPQNLFNPLP